MELLAVTVLRRPGRGAAPAPPAWGAGQEGAGTARACARCGASGMCPGSKAQGDQEVGGWGEVVA